MKAYDLILAAKKQGITLYLKDGALAFTAKKGAMTNEIKSQLSNNKQALVDFLKKLEHKDDSITRSSDKNVLSYAQQGFALLDKLEAERSAFNISMALKLKGALNKDALKKTMRSIIERHEILRTTYQESKDGSFKPVILSSIAFDLPVIELTVTENIVVQKEVQRIINEEAATPFNLSVDLMLRASIIKLNDLEHILMVSMHHIASDAWSQGVLIDEISSLYTAFCSEGDIPLPALPLQYSDYANWQRQQLSGESLNGHLAFWKSRLDGIPSVHNIPTSFIRPKIQHYQGRNFSTVLGEPLLEKVIALGKKHDATLFMVMQTAFAVLLSRYSGDKDIVVGTPVGNRENSQLAKLVGCFMNMLPLRTKADEKYTFSEILTQSKRDFVEALEHKDLPFEKIVEVIHPERSASYAPIFQSMFVLQNNGRNDIELPHLQTEIVEQQRQFTKYDLTLTAAIEEDGVLLDWEYAQALFEETYIENMARNFEVLLNSIVSLSNEPISSLPLLSEQESNLLEKWNETEASYSTDKTIIGLFERQASKSPKKTALTFKNNQLNYQELNEKASCFALYLTNQGVMPGDIVALGLERSVEMVVAILGVMKAGAAYLPLDYLWPKERIEAIIGDANPAMVITSEYARSVFQDINVKHLLFSVDNELPTLPETHLHQRSSSINPESLAYVIYTSGSTGKPKGVMVEHLALINRIEWMRDQYAVGTEDVVIQKTPYTFDVSVWEFLLPLITGARLVVAPPEAHKSPDELMDIIQAEDVSIIHFVPSMLNVMLEYGQLDACKSLKHVICSGEALNIDTTDKFFALGTTAKLQNLYGPTEAAIDVSHWQCEETSTRSFIGKPIHNIQLFVLDSHGAKAPIGVVGELHIGGVGLARGYLNNDKLTQSCFQNTQYGKLYKTGDLARFHLDGNIEYIGRTDNQVKIRGLRVELSEIENILRLHADVADAAVKVQTDDEGTQSIVAYIQASHSSEFHAEEILNFAAKKLPDFMVPIAMTTVESFPLSDNGKRDLKALPQIDISADVDFEEPTNETEKFLCSIFQSELGLKKVGANHSFFQSGGDSIQAIKLVAKCRKHGFRVSVKQLMEAHSIKQLSNLVEKCDDDQAQNIPAFSLLSKEQLEQLKEANNIDLLEDAYPMTLLQEGMIYHSEVDIEKGVYHDLVGSQIRIDWQKELFEQALSHMVEKHSALRTLFYSLGTSQLQLVQKKARYNLEVVDLTSLSSHEQESFIQNWMDKDKRQPFEAGCSPWKITIHLLKTNEISYFLSVHHALLDGWSVASFDTELFDRYWHLLNRKDYIEPPIAPLDYRHYIADELAARNNEETSAFWTSHLSDVQTSWWTSQGNGNIDVCPVNISPASSREISRIAKALKVSERSVLLTAHICLMSFISGQSRVVTSAVSNARPEIEGSEQTLGLFLNAQPVSLDIDGKSWKELICEVESEAVTLFSHRFYPASKIQTDLGVDLSASLFNYTSFHVYNNIKGKIDTVKFAGSVQNNYQLNAEYSKNLATGAFELSLLLDEGVFNKQFQNRIVNYAEQIISSLTLALDNSIDTEQWFSTDELLTLKNQRNQPTVFKEKDTLISRFKQSVASFGQATALRFNDLTMSYEQLDVISDQVAISLKESGVQTNELIGLCIEPSFELIATLIGILKHGCAYLPLDSNNPSERLGQMLSDSQVKLLYTQTQYRSLFNGLSMTIVEVDDPIFSEKLSHNKKYIANNEQVKPQTLAYTIYTSGSTGVPKGVLVDHQNVVRLLDAGQQYYQFGSSDVWPLFHSYSFDVSVWEIWGALFYGGSLVIVPRDCAKSTADFYQLVVDENVTVLNQTPAAFYQFIEIDQKLKGLLKLRYVVLAGDKLSLSLLEPWFDRHEDIAPKLINMYGITETTVHSTIRHITKGDLRTPAVSPIGLPLLDLNIYLLDEHGKLVPTGVPGEIYVGGRGVTQGYLNRKELTQERFIESPFCVNERLYKSGDQAVLTDAHEYTYIGRIDKQVKIRGYRIEIGEIEALVQKHAQVKHVHICVMDLNSSHQSLVAYIAHKGSRDTLEQELRHSIDSSLPFYMMPSIFMLLDELPLNINGKINARLLPKPSETHFEFTSPTTDTEVALCKLWCELLDYERIGIHQNFFHCGGDSLLAVRLVNDIDKALNIDVKIKDIMLHPTISLLAEYIDQQERKVQKIPSIEHDPAGRFEPFPLTEVQQAYWFGRQDGFSLGNIGTHSYSEIPLPAIYLDKLNDVWQTLIQRHDMLRMVIDESGNQKVLECVPDYNIEQTSLISLNQTEKNEHLAKVRQEMSHQVFSCLTWPLFDLRVTKVNAEKIILHVSMDALVVDASSAQIITNEFGGLLIGNADLNPLAIEFRDYVLADIKHKNSGIYESARSYWMDRVDSFPLKPELPLLTDPSQITEPRFERRSFQLDQALWHQLKEVAANQQITPTVLVMGAFADVLRLWGENENFALNLTLFDRSPFHVDVPSIVGDFTTLTLLECNSANESSKFVDRVKAMQKQLWYDIEQRSFSGIEFQRALSKHHQMPVNYPIVVTSTIGFEHNEDLEKQFQQFEINDVYSITQTSQVWLDFKMYEHNKNLICDWDNVEGLFPENMIDSMLSSLQNLLHELINEHAWEQLQVAQIPSTQKELIKCANSDSIAISEQLLHQAVVEQAAKSPNAIAIKSKERCLTYEDLESLSRQVAIKLIEQNVKPNDLIAVVMDKGWQQVVAVLGILRAGAAYLPIDASLPQARIDNLLSTSDASIAITNELSVSCIGTELLNINLDAFFPYKQEFSLPPIETTCTDLAYVIFTSGSTGLPKGVMLEHKAVLNTIVDINQRFGVTADDVAFGISNLNFDLSVYDIFGLLSVGGSVVLPASSEVKEPERWCHYIQEYGVTLWNSVPALMQMFVEYIGSNNVSNNLRLIMLSGDWIPTHLPQNIRLQFANAELISLGGATEAAIWSIFYPIEKVHSDWNSIPYGKALSNQSCFVLKPNMSLAPVGTEGDLYIGGIGLARGYWKDRVKTDKSFIFNAQMNERLYFTGDRGRLLADGNIEFLGRRDSQVKVQGHRIELGEIENNLRRHSEVDDALVTTYEQGNSTQLVAYVINKENKPQTLTTDATQFKLAQNGVRNLTGNNLGLTEVGVKEEVLLNPYINVNETSNDPVSFEQLCQLLNLYNRKSLDGLLFSKALYPSAGSLYPVQVYLFIPANKLKLFNGDFCPAGYYYYNPIENTLIALPQRAELSGCIDSIQIAFCADLSAIKPVYNDEAELFCQLETGYMLGLGQQSARHQLLLKEAIVDKNVWFQGAQLNEQHRIISVQNICCVEKDVFGNETNSQDRIEVIDQSSSFISPVTDMNDVSINYYVRKSYRQFAKGALSLDAFSLTLHLLRCCVDGDSTKLRFYFQINQNLINEDQTETLKRGFYEFRVANNQLVKVGSIGNGKESLFKGSEAAMANSASFGLFIVSATDVDNQLPIEVGFIGQNLLQYLPSKKVGICPVGIVKQRLLRQTFNLGETHTVIHSFVGGAIAEDLIKNQVASNASQVQGWFDMDLMLRQSLPDYMVPTAYQFIDKIPLTNNGKLDRSKLPKDNIGNTDLAYIEPANEIEYQLQKICESLLDTTRLSVTKNLLQAGSDSLTLVKLTNELRDKFNIKLGIGEAYQAENIRQLAVLVEERVDMLQRFAQLTNEQSTEDDVERIVL